MENQIRPAVKQDAEALESFINGAYRGDAAKQGWTTEADLLDGTRTDADMIRDILDRDDTEMLLMLDGEEIVACVELRKEGHKTYLGMLTVSPTRQGQGLGKVMMRAGEKYGKEQGSRIMYMTVLTARPELIAWYVRHGYKNTGQTKPFEFDDPRYGQPKQPLEFVVLTKKL